MRRRVVCVVGDINVRAVELKHVYRSLSLTHSPYLQFTSCERDIKFEVVRIKISSRSYINTSCTGQMYCLLYVLRPLLTMQPIAAIGLSNRLHGDRLHRV